MALQINVNALQFYLKTLPHLRDATQINSINVFKADKNETSNIQDIQKYCKMYFDLIKFVNSKKRLFHSYTFNKNSQSFNKTIKNNVRKLRLMRLKETNFLMAD